MVFKQLKHCGGKTDKLCSEEIHMAEHKPFMSIICIEYSLLQLSSDLKRHSLRTLLAQLRVASSILSSSARNRKVSMQMSDTVKFFTDDLALSELPVLPVSKTYT